jgi:two-component system cell cycle response regulator CtrA
MRVLLIENDASRDVSLILRRHDLNFDGVSCLEEAIHCAQTYDYDVVIVEDHSASPRDIQRLRLARIAAPLIVVSPNLPVGRSALLLNSGADDCMPRPLSSHELVARIRALARRARGHCMASFCFGPMTVDLASKKVAINQTQVSLNRKEYQLLEALFLRQGVAVSKETLINQIYMDGLGPDSPMIELYVCRLRKKLAAAADGRRFIETVRDGYMLPRAA